MKTTNELRVGDIIIYADELNLVRDVLVDGSDVQQVIVKRWWPDAPGRKPVNTWFYAGTDAQHVVAYGDVKIPA